jgi:NAD(P)H-flavin reductase
VKKLELEVVHVLEEPPEEWDGEKGFISPEVLERHLPDEGFARMFLICGPPPMMAAAHAAALERGVPERMIQMEKFNLA